MIVDHPYENRDAANPNPTGLRDLKLELNLEMNINDISNPKAFTKAFTSQLSLLSQVSPAPLVCDLRA